MLVEAADVIEQDLTEVAGRRSLVIIAQVSRHGRDDGRERAARALVRGAAALLVACHPAVHPDALARLVDVRLVLVRVALGHDR